MHADLRGFYGAPVTYAASMAIGAASSASILFGYGRFFLLQRDGVLLRNQHWRLFSNQLAFHHGLAASLGLYLLFQFRVLERQMGSRKFGSLLFFIWLITAALQLTVLVSWPAMSRGLPAGPYTVLGALTVYFLKYVPRLYPKAYSLLGINFSDKSTTYAVLLVLLGRNPRTLLSFLPGITLGVLFSATPLSKLQLPSFICTLFSILHPFFDVVPASAVAQQRQRRMMEAQRRLGVRAGNAAAAGGGGAGGHGFRDQLLPGAGGGAGGAAGMLPPHQAAAPAPLPISEAAIEQLLALGFDRERVLTALQAADNNVEAAANRLLNGL